MDAAEWDISRSSPFARFDQAAAAAPTPAPAPTPAADDQARRLLAAAIGDPAAPLVVYGLSWCEYGWSVRKLFDALGADHRWINLDDPELLATDLGIRLRAALEQHTGSRTLPQVFLGGRFLGGCSETFAAHADGSLASRLEALGHPPRRRSIPNAGQMLPAWRQKTAASAGG
ncbi:glutaredoxin domain-containing protein [uncultured Arenimonas sp.]|uniref:glutaredoxin domain-containing protein n=1 Tax=uncultured Arenimonas sp. TaxID=546226 RepID=UPI0030DA2912